MTQATPAARPESIGALDPGVPGGVPRRRLVYLAPAVRSSPEAWRQLQTRLADEPGFGTDTATWCTFDHGVRPWTFGSAEELSTRLAHRINMQWEKAGGYDDVVLVGHSFGGLLMRRAYLIGAGASAASPTTKHEWARHVSRIVLFAAANRGVDKTRGFQIRFGSWLARMLPLPHLALEDIICGGVFLTNVRIDWIRHFGRAAAEARAAPHGGAVPCPVPHVVQLIGTDDAVVAHDDSRDVLAFGNADEIVIPDADHGNLYRLGDAPDPDGRYALIRNAFVPRGGRASPDVPATAAERLSSRPLGRQTSDNRRSAPGGVGAAKPIEGPTLLNADGMAPAQAQADHIVFLLHGIRASSVDEWIAQLRTRIHAQKVAGLFTTRPTYGYFTAIRFARPSVRRRNARRFRDWYADLLADHPTAKFSIVAHSNGTYMLGQTLLKSRGMVFENVVLAGSVLPTDYPWDDLVRRGQVRRVLNERAYDDVPVGFLCSALRGIRQRDVGPAGFAGFKGSGAVLEVAYHRGGHGAALRPDNLNRLVAFVTRGECDAPADLSANPGFFRQLSNVAPWIGFAGIALLAAGVVAFVLTGLDGFALDPARQILARAGLVSLGALVVYIAGDMF